MDSLLNQAFADFEVILIDDGSSDDSGALCDEYAFHHTRVRIVHQANAGVSTARNRGIEAAHGEFIAFVDADDWVGSTFLQAFAEEVKAHPEVDAVVQGFVDQEGHVQQEAYAYWTSADEIGNHLYPLEEKQLMGYVWNKLFRREMLETFHVRFDPDIPIGEDFIFCMEAISHCQRLAVLPCGAYHYTFTGFKEHAFDAFVRRQDAMDSLLARHQHISQTTVHQFQSREFQFSLYIFHVLYRENRPRKERIEYLQKTRERAHGNPEIAAYKLSHPYIWLAIIVLYLPLGVADYLLKRIYT